MQIRSSHVGLLAGLAFGWLAIHYDVFRAVFVAVCAVAGWYVGRILDGEIDVQEYLRRGDRDLRE